MPVVKLVSLLAKLACRKAELQASGEASLMAKLACGEAKLQVSGEANVLAKLACGEAKLQASGETRQFGKNATDHPAVCVLYFRSFDKLDIVQIS